MSKNPSSICHLRGPKVATRFPTKYHPIRSAWKQKILLPEGLVHNPAPSAPSPLETPAAFLPKSDIRLTKRYAGSVDTSKMPLLKSPTKTVGTRLTKDDCHDIQRLRDSEPEIWTLKALSQKFRVPERVISMVSKPNKDRVQEMERRLAQIKSMWSPKTVIARESRKARRDAWLRDA